MQRAIETGRSIPQTVKEAAINFLHPEKALTQNGEPVEIGIVETLETMRDNLAFSVAHNTPLQSDEFSRQRLQELLRLSTFRRLATSSIVNRRPDPETIGEWTRYYQPLYISGFNTRLVLKGGIRRVEIEYRYYGDSENFWISTKGRGEGNDFTISVNFHRSEHALYIPRLEKGLLIGKFRTDGSRILNTEVPH